MLGFAIDNSAKDVSLSTTTALFIGIFSEEELPRFTTFKVSAETVDVQTNANATKPAQMARTLLANIM